MNKFENGTKKKVHSTQTPYPLSLHGTLKSNSTSWRERRRIYGAFPYLLYVHMQERARARHDHNESIVVLLLPFRRLAVCIFIQSKIPKFLISIPEVGDRANESERASERRVRLRLPGNSISDRGSYSSPIERTTDSITSAYFNVPLGIKIRQQLVRG